MASEIWFDGIFLNLPPVSVKNIGLKLEKLVSTVKSLRDYPAKKRGPTWVKNMQQLTIDLEIGWDIRSFHPTSIAILTEEYEVEIGDDEEHLYKDNCVPVDGKCPRKMVVGGTDQVWLKAALERVSLLEKREEFADKKDERTKQVREALKKISDDNRNSIVKEQDNVEDINCNDESFKVPKNLKHSTVVPSFRASSKSTRSSSYSSPSKSTASGVFPDIACRSGYKNIDPTIVEVMVVMESKYKVEQRQVAPLLAYVMNNLAGQNWQIPSEETEVLENNDKEDRSCSRNRRPSRDLTYVLPSRKTIRKRLEDASLLNFQYAAKAIQDANTAGGTVTLGVDDTIKASGFRVHDVKTGRITIVENKAKKDDLENDDGSVSTKTRQTFSTGFLPNISHSGQHSAMNVRTWVSQMAVLCEVQYEEMFDFFNFFMNDRASDSDAMLDELGVETEKRLKCNGHILLAVQAALDKVYKDQETCIGAHKLISTDAAHVFSSPKNSIWTLGLIAFSKLLSPSHAQESISLYKSYKQYLQEDSIDEQSETKEVSKKLLKNGFQKFSSNRFGRMLSLSETFEANKTTIRKFYDDQVDEHANKLVLACFAYLNSEWFQLCCKIATNINELVVLPMKEALGMDEGRSSKSDSRSWTGLKVLFKSLLDNLSSRAVKKPGMTGFELLECQAALKISTAMTKQLSYMDFYKDEMELPQKVLDKIDEAPLTNSGAESNFAQLDLECRRGSGQTKLKTMSDRHVVKSNKYFESDQWKNLSPELKQKEWNFARNSEKAKIVKEMQRDFFAKVAAADKIANKEKVLKKQKKNIKMLEAFEKVKSHGGPVTANSLNILQEMSEKEILEEVKLLRMTVAPNIREKRKVDNKFVKFTKEELISQIENVLKPEDDLSADIDSLLLSSMKENTAETANKEEEQPEKEDDIGNVAVFEGPLGQRKVGVIVAEATLQLYSQCRYGFQCDDLTVDSHMWKSVIPIEDYDFITRRTGVYMRCGIKNQDLN